MDRAASPERSPALDPDKLEREIGQPGDGGLPVPGDVRNADGSSLRGGEDILALQDLDPALNMKMHLVNNVSEADARRRPRGPSGADRDPQRQLMRLDGRRIISSCSSSTASGQ